MRNRLKKSKRIVVKVGSSSLFRNGVFNDVLVHNLAQTLYHLRKRGLDCVLVSSGAVAIGSSHLQWTQKPQKISDKQAVAAIGQGLLMHRYHDIFQQFNQPIAQVLLTKDVVQKERRYNAINTFTSLFDMGVIPIVNENDTVATDEILVGDNDTLSALVAQLVEADVLILLTDTEGLYTANPKESTSAKLISEVNQIDEKIEKQTKDVGSSFGTGGMYTKIQAAKIARAHGIPTVIAHSEVSEVVEKILAGKIVGTIFNVCAK